MNTFQVGALRGVDGITRAIFNFKSTEGGGKGLKGSRRALFKPEIREPIPTDPELFQIQFLKQHSTLMSDEI